METDNSPMSSMCMVRAEELYPKIQMEKDDEQLKVPLVECECTAAYLLHVVSHNK